MQRKMQFHDLSKCHNQSGFVSYFCFLIRFERGQRMKCFVWNSVHFDKFSQKLKFHFVLLIELM